MTREEIIKMGNGKFPHDIIEIINDDGSITREDVNFKLRKAYMEGLIDNNISLPSNLDEAAEEYAGVNYDCETEPDAFYHHIETEAFKVGASWMAGQGETVDAEVVATSENGWESVRIFKKLHNVGDKVVVQIRKK